MSQIPAELRYSKDHEWARLSGKIACVGITEHAQSELGDIVFVELPGVGDKVQQGDRFGTIEAVKTVAELYAPVSGVVVEINTALGDSAGVINSDPYGQGWIARIELSDSSEWECLMDASAYSQFIQ